MPHTRLLFKTELFLLDLLASSRKEHSSYKYKRLKLTTKEWDELIRIASWQGVAAIVCNQIEQIPKDLLPSRKQILNLIGIKISQQHRYQQQQKIASAFGKALKKNGVKMFILKGFAYSSYYEDPLLRVCGDCDCFLVDSSNNPAFAKGNEVAKQLNAKIDYNHYKHSHIQLGGLMIENHEFLTDFDSTKQGVITEKLLRNIIIKDKGTNIFDTDMVKPSDYFNLLFLVRHAHGDFMDGGITLRILYDFTVILKKVENNIDWVSFYKDLKLCKLDKFFNIIASISIKYFGLALKDGHIIYETTPLVDEIMLDTISGGLHTKGKENILKKSKRIIKRFRRMWHYRNIATESYFVMVWNSFAFCSYLHRKVSI